jgi:hypothetical protein
MEIIRAESQAEFPDLEPAAAITAFVATTRGKTLHQQYAAAKPAPVTTKKSSVTESEVLGSIRKMAADIAKRDGIPEAEAFNNAVETEEGKRLHQQYANALPDPEPAPVAKAVLAEPVDIIAAAIVEETRKIAKSDDVSIVEADRRLRQTPRGRVLMAGYASARR